MQKRLVAWPAYPWRRQMHGGLRRGAVLSSIVLAGLASSGGIAAAAPGPTPDEGLTGACNMTNTHAAFGMFDKAVQSGPGLDGMFTAIINSGGDCID
jgi:hypothetical protein